MSTIQSEPAVAAPAEGLRIGIVYRDGDGSIHFDVPPERIPDALADTRGTLWVDLDDRRAEGISSHDVESLLANVFRFHPLAIEDAIQDTHVPKVDDWGQYLYIVFHTLDCHPETHEIQLHELDIFLGSNYLVTYHNERMAFLEQLRRNLEKEPTKRLKHGADHLLYHVLDMCVGEYLPAIESLDEAIDRAQDEVFGQPTPRTLQKIFQIKRSALRLHRVLAPEREVVNRLARDDYDPVNPDHRIYFRDVYDHIVRVHDIAETLRDLISGALDTYLSAISNRTNEIMKALTLVTVMFLPMSFLAGFFGMNFFGATLAFETALPKAFLFSMSCVLMVGTPIFMYLWARLRRWF
jgi:magnesium transporter